MQSLGVKGLIIEYLRYLRVLNVIERTKAPAHSRLVYQVNVTALTQQLLRHNDLAPPGGKMQRRATVGLNKTIRIGGCVMGEK